MEDGRTLKNRKVLVSGTFDKRKRKKKAKMDWLTTKLDFKRK